MAFEDKSEEQLREDRTDLAAQLAAIDCEINRRASERERQSRQGQVAPRFTLAEIVHSPPD